MMRLDGSRAVWASALVYAGLTAVVGRRVLASLGGAIASDPGDPVLTASILSWNATRVPGSEAWWQFPSFYPTTGATAFTEHLLGLSAIATPLHWLIGNPIAAYNLTLLATYPLCALALYALAYRLTRSHAAAFLGGLAFAFAPYRVSQLPHIQVLAFFWAPLALLGLHAWLETRRRRWLVLFGACWALQAASNAYMLVFLSLFTFAWMLWFLAPARRWRDAAAALAVLIAASAPLAPLLYRYLTEHARHGFSRGFGEIAFFGADIAGVLCASPQLTFWGWLRAACRPEGELFAGAGLLILCGVTGAGLLWARRRETPRFDPGAVPPAQTSLRFVRRLVLAVATVYALIVLTVIVFGPWQIAWGPLRASVTSAVKPLSALFTLLLVAGVLSPPLLSAARRSSIAVFYAGAALVAWVLAWGPAPKFFGEEVLYMAPYRWLMYLPGMDGLRVPARFWTIAVLCLAVLLALLVSEWLKGRSKRVAVATVAAGAILVASDGWTVMPAAAPPPLVSDSAALRGALVLELPFGDVFGDVAAQYRAVMGGWTTVNGYSGYEPAYYEALRTAARTQNDVLFAPFRQERDLHVLVTTTDPRLRAFVERQPDAEHLGAAGAFLHYRLPRRDDAFPAGLPVEGRLLPIHDVTGSCDAGRLRGATLSDSGTVWHCGPQTSDEAVIVDLGDRAIAHGLVHALGSFPQNFPRHLVVQTSLDGASWEDAWDGDVLAAVIRAAMDDPRAVRVAVGFDPRPARYIRLGQVGRDEVHPWSIAALEVWGE